MEDVLKSFNEDLVGRGSIREEYKYVYVVYYDVYVYIYVCVLVYTLRIAFLSDLASGAGFGTC